MKIRDVVAILLDEGFVLDRRRGSHRQYEGRVAGKRRVVTVAGRDGDDVNPKNLGSMIRQSGLPKKLFR